MNIDIIVSENTIAPAYATKGSAAVDLRAAIDAPVKLYPGFTSEIPTGLKMAIPDGVAGIILPRSGLGSREGIVLANLVGLIDSDYRGEITVTLWNRNSENNGRVFLIEPGDKLCQMMFIPHIKVVMTEVEELPPTTRGSGGHGSTGVK